MGVGPPEPEKAEQLPALARTFEHRGRPWLARIAGEGACGTGARGRAYVVAIHFCPAENESSPVREALVAAACFAALDEDELRALYDAAKPIEVDEH